MLPAETRARLRSAAPTLAGVLGAGLALLGAAAWAAQRFDVASGLFTVDPAQLLAGDPRLRPFLGGLSNLGAVVWGAGASVAAFAAALPPRPGAPERRGYLGILALLSLLLLLDDLFLVHEILIPLHLGLDETAPLPVYGGLLAVALWRYRALALRTELLLLGSALLLFAVSIAVDQTVPRNAPHYHLYEDGAKFLGIGCWCAYLVRTSWMLTRRPTESADAQP